MTKELTPEQDKQVQWWRYLTKGIDWKHQTAWYDSLLREKGLEEAELFLKYVKWSNRVEI